jgi:hypothetical protein
MRNIVQRMKHLRPSTVEFTSSAESQD